MPSKYALDLLPRPSVFFADHSRRDTPGNGAPLQYLATAPSPPVSQSFRPPMTVLTRKPAPKLIARRDPVTGLSNLTLENDSDEEEDKKPQETPEEIRARQQRERDEKQRRYDEVRAKIFGESSPAATGPIKGSGRSSGQSTPGAVTPPNQRGGGERRGRGRGRGGHRGGDRADRGGDRNDRTPQRPIGQSAGANAAAALYDPNYSPKPGYTPEGRGAAGGGPAVSRRSTPRDDEQVIRAPRGPEGGGRGGFGFARRGGNEG